MPEPARVVGVMAPDFSFPYRTMLGPTGVTRAAEVDVWLPLAFEGPRLAGASGYVRHIRLLGVVARLAPGATVDASAPSGRQGDDVAEHGGRARIVAAGPWCRARRPRSCAAEDDADDVLGDVVDDALNVASRSCPPTATPPPPARAAERLEEGHACSSRARRAQLRQEIAGAEQVAGVLHAVISGPSTFTVGRRPHGAPRRRDLDEVGGARTSACARRAAAGWSRRRKERRWVPAPFDRGGTTHCRSAARVITELTAKGVKIRASAGEAAIRERCTTLS